MTEIIKSIISRRSVKSYKPTPAPTELLDAILEAGTYAPPGPHKSRNTYIYDGSLVMENLMLAAHSLGLGSCWIHRAKEVFETAEGKALLSSLGIEGDYEGIGNCIIGYPDKLPAERKPRKSDYIYKV